MRRLAVVLLALLVFSCGGGNELALTELTAEADCQATAARCVASGEGIRVELQLPPNPEPLKPFQVQVRITGLPVEAPMLELFMVSMDMGDNRYRLISSGADTWTANVILPICIAGRADWMADIIVRTDKARYRARFPFSTGG